MQLNLLSDFDLFALQFHFIKVEIHPDVNKVDSASHPCGMHMKRAADRHAALSATPEDIWVVRPVN